MEKNKQKITYIALLLLLVLAHPLQANNYWNEKLLKSAAWCQLDEVKKCLKEGASIHYKDKRGNTALHYSALKGDIACLIYLIQQGADIHNKNKNGCTAMILSAQGGHLNCLQYLLTLSPDDIKATNKWGDTALYRSASNGHLNCVKYLVEQGADIHAKNDRGDTPLYIATLFEHEDVVKYLEKEVEKTRWFKLPLS